MYCLLISFFAVLMILHSFGNNNVRYVHSVDPKPAKPIECIHKAGVYSKPQSPRRFFMCGKIE